MRNLPSFLPRHKIAKQLGLRSFRVRLVDLFGGSFVEGWKSDRLSFIMSKLFGLRQSRQMQAFHSA